MNIILYIIIVPGSVLQPPAVPLSDIGSTFAIVSWSPPPNPNGVIENYTVTAQPISYVNSSLARVRTSRCLRYLQRKRLIVVNTNGTVTSVNLTGLCRFNKSLSFKLLYSRLQYHLLCTNL